MEKNRIRPIKSGKSSRMSYARQKEVVSDGKAEHPDLKRRFFLYYRKNERLPVPAGEFRPPIYF